MKMNPYCSILDTLWNLDFFDFRGPTQISFDFPHMKLGFFFIFDPTVANCCQLVLTVANCSQLLLTVTFCCQLLQAIALCCQLL